MINDAAELAAIQDAITDTLTATCTLTRYGAADGWSEPTAGEPDTVACRIRRQLREVLPTGADPASGTLISTAQVWVSGDVDLIINGTTCSKIVIDLGDGLTRRVLGVSEGREPGSTVVSQLAYLE